MSEDKSKYDQWKEGLEPHELSCLLMDQAGIGDETRDLFSASPKMLDALIAVMNYEGVGQDTGNLIIEALLAALPKAVVAEILGREP